MVETFVPKKSMTRLIKKNIRKLFRRKEKMFPGVSFCEKVPGLSALKTPLVKWLVDDPIDVMGHQMYLDLPDSLGLRRNPCYGKLETALLESLVHPGDTVLDLGANIGYFTLLFARWTGANGRVLAFEPDPVNFSFVKRNLEANAYHHVEPHPMAVSDKSGQLRLYVCAYNRGDHRSYDPGESRQVVEIEAVTLDHLLGPNFPNVDFIKMDIQGAEGLAVRGMQKLLSAQEKIVMFIEFWPSAMATAGVTAHEMLAMLEAGGFHFEELDEASGKLCPVQASGLLETYTVANGISTNLLCTKGG